MPCGFSVIYAAQCAARPTALSTDPFCASDFGSANVMDHFSTPSALLDLPIPEGGRALPQARLRLQDLREISNDYLPCWVCIKGLAWGPSRDVLADFTLDPAEERLRPRLLTIGMVGYLIRAFTGPPLLLSGQAFLFWGSLRLLRACSQLDRPPSVAHPPSSSLSTPPAL